MHAPTLVLGSVAFLSAFASAVEAERRPKFYFPRQVKRQIFTNSTITSSAPEETTPSTLTTSTRRSLTDILSDITGGNSDSRTPTQTPDEEEPVTTVTISTRTTFEVPSPTEETGSQSTGGVPEVIVLPTESPAETTPADATTPESTPASSSSGGILFGPGGILSSPEVTPTPTPTPSDAETTSSTDDGVTFTGPGGGTTAAPEPSSTSEESSATPTPIVDLTLLLTTTPEEETITAEPTSTPSSTPDEPTVAPTTREPSTSAAPEETTETPTLTPTSTPETTPETTPQATSTESDIITASDSVIVTPNPTPTPEPETTTSKGLVDIISDILSPTPSVDLPEVTISSELPELPTTTSLPVELPITTSAPVELPITSTDLPITETPIVVIPGTTTLPDTVSVPTDGPTTVIDPVTTSTPVEPPVDTSTTVIVDPAPGNGTTTTPPGPVITDPPVPGNETTVIPPDTVTDAPPAPGNETTVLPPLPPVISTPTVLPGNATTPPGPVITQSPPANGTTIGVPITSQVSTGPIAGPTGTPVTDDTGTSMDMGPSLIAAPTQVTTPGVSQTAEPTGISSDLPKVIVNPNQNFAERPADSIEVQIGFLYPLNYKFVVANSMSSAQIFEYLPQGMADGLGLLRDDVTIKSLLPLDTTAQIGFITTVARAYIPSDKFAQLKVDIHLPASSLYNNDDERVNTLMNYINAAIPLTPGDTLAGGAGTGTGSGDSATSTAGAPEDAVFNDSQATSSGKVNGTTAGFVVAGIGGAAAYGAAMFLIARRYKKRKQSHRRSQSSANPSEMMYSGAPFMSGGRLSSNGSNDRNSRGSGRTGNSARTAQISAPMMAENSLGWN